MSDRFDDAIDRAVREMLDVEPRADLRARVMARLPPSGSRLPASGFRLPASGWVLAPLAAAALIVLAVFIARRTEPLPEGRTIARAADQYLVPDPTVPVRAVEPPIVIPPTRVTPPAQRTVSGGTIVAAMSAVDADGTTAIDPLRSIAPIGMSPIARDTIAPAEVAVRPLNTITEIQIAPLTPQDRR